MTRCTHKRGQVVLLLAFMLLGLVFLLLVNADVFLAAHRKNRLQNAGDAATLAAARWQGITLNAIGALNLAKIDYACKAGNPETNPVEWADVTNVCTRLSALQQRLAFAGPLMGFYAAQRAAIKNGVTEQDPDMSALVGEAINRASLLQGDGATGGDLWPQKPQDYADMLRGAARDGVYVGADNAQYYNFAIPEAYHPLYDKAFYSAVAGSDWCWFYFRDDMRNLLTDFAGWGDVPAAGGSSADNPEFFGVDVHLRSTSLARLYGDDDAEQARQIVARLAERNGCPHVSDLALQLCGVITNHADFAWMCYGSEWHEWERMHLASPARLPLKSDVQDRYNVQGAFAATRVHQILEPFTPDAPRRWNEWTAAAKPFGEIDGHTVTLDGEFALVSPAFTAVRLTMLGAYSESRMNMADSAWLTHVRDHVQTQTFPVDDCSYCTVLATWNTPSFRQTGRDWLNENGDDRCHRPTGGGAPGGGTRHAH